MWRRVGGALLLGAAGSAAIGFVALQQPEPANPPLLDERRFHRSGYTDPGGALGFRRLQLQDENGEVPLDGLEKARRHVELMQAARAERNQAQQEITGHIVPDGAGITPGSWTWLGPGNIGGRVRSILVDPQDANRLWVGSVSGGIWQTTNGGDSWSPVNDFLANLAVSSMAADPSNPNTMYAGTGEGFGNDDAIRGAGIYKSTDRGITWSLLESTSLAGPFLPMCGTIAAPPATPANPPCPTFWAHVNRIAVSHDGTIILAATNAGVARSTDGGSSWVQTTDVRTMDIDFIGQDAPPRTFIRCVAGELGSARHSIDGGLTWTASTFDPPIANGGTRASNGRVELSTLKLFDLGYVYASVNQNGGEIYRSNDSGASYTRYSTGKKYLGDPSIGWYTNLIWNNPNDPDDVIVGGVYLWRGRINTATSDTDLQPISDGSDSPHADNHVIVPHPSFSFYSGNRTIFVGTDGGIFRADDFSAAKINGPNSGWSNRNNALGITQFYGAGVQNSTGVVIGGTQDNGTLRFTGDPEDWKEMFHSDGGFVAIDQTDSSYVYGERQNLQVVRSSDGGLTAKFIFSGIGDTCPEPEPPPPATCTPRTNFIAPLVLDPSNPHTLLAGGEQLWRTQNPRMDPPVWTSIKPALPMLGSDVNSISAIAISPKDPDLILVGHNGGHVFRTTRGTAATLTASDWTDISASLPARMVTRVVIDPHHDPPWFYVTYGGFQSGNIRRSTDNGATWTDITGSGATALPQVPVRTLVVHPENTNYLYVGTEIGIFTSEDGGATWDVSQDGPANVSVDELFFRSDNSLYAATHGRGVYKTASVGVPPEVRNASASGAGSLREAILRTAEITGAARVIRFNIPGPGVKTINLAAPLPHITKPVVIDGWSQGGPGYTGPPLIELNGAGAGVDNAIGLFIAGGDSIVQGLAINRFNDEGIILSGPGGNVVRGCYIGVDPTGTATRANGSYGIAINSSAYNLIGTQNSFAERNVISGNWAGIHISGAAATGNRIRGNFIGTDVTGLLPLNNLQEGIRISGAPSNTIGGDDPLYRNVIGACGTVSFGADGIEILGTGAGSNQIVGNFIGIGADGETTLRNLGSGIRIENAPNTMIGGTRGILTRNVISGGRNQGGIALYGTGSSGTIIQGNFLGTNFSGTSDRYNNATNIYIESANNTIGGTAPGAGNLLAGYVSTAGKSIDLFGYANSTGNVIQGNLIGTDATGTARLSNVGTGIEVRGGSTGTLIGGTTAAARNIISGNGIAVNIGASNTTVQGNYIGTDVTGTASVRNTIGIKVGGGSNHLIGGTTPGAGNVMSGNGTGGNDHGLSLANTTGTVVQGNKIGTNAAGTAILPNAGVGIQVSSSSNCLIGGATAAARNIISGNVSNGVWLASGNGNTVQGNYIGTDVTGLLDFGNGRPSGAGGVEIASSNNIIGGVNPGEGNLIAFNGCAGCFGVNAGNGVRVFGSGNSIRGNVFRDNIKLAINLSTNTDGSSLVTANDNCDADGGPNGLQNFPVITAANSANGQTTISGTLNSIAEKLYTLDFYASTACDNSGHGEAGRYLGSSSVSVGGSCSQSFNVVLPVALQAGEIVTATATDPAGNTSEFSGCATASVAPRITHFLPQSGLRGAGVTIFGAGFNTATGVSFNGAGAAFVKESDQVIHTSVPAGAASGPIAIAGSGGTGNSAAQFIVLADSDVDGMSDAFEQEHFGDATAGDPNADNDGDGFTNLQEQLAGTHPRNSESALRITETRREGNDVVVVFRALAGKLYRVEADADLAGNFPIVIGMVSRADSDRTVEIKDVGGRTHGRRFYRAVVLP
jgi:hypothetical protein